MPAIILFSACKLVRRDMSGKVGHMKYVTDC